MKRFGKIIASVLILALILTCTGIAEELPQLSYELAIPAEEFDAISPDDPEMLAFIEDAVYCQLADTLDPDQYFIEEVSAVYVSREYLEECEYNQKANIFFGYSLEELDAAFEGTRYVFTLGDDGKTNVEPFVEIPNETFNQIVRNVAIGTGVIIVCVVVAAVTQNPAAAASAGKAVKAVFTISSAAAKGAATFAVTTAGISGATAAITTGFQTNDMDCALEAGILAASEGYKYGAIAGAVQGIAAGIIQVKESGRIFRKFKTGTEQAELYPEGVEFTKHNGELYPRFEKWAKATAKFDKPTKATALNHTGLSGNYYWDAKLANAQCGFKCTPKGYVWHHVEDMQTMILVPQKLHSVAFDGMPHIGGASLIKAFLA